METTEQTQQTDKQKSAAIWLSIDIEANFKLYSYRIISHDQFIARTNELVKLYQKATKDVKTKTETVNDF